jgi:hypothetical protein
MADEQAAGRWFIDLDWLERNNRSFAVLARSCLCHACHQRFWGGGEAISAAGIISSVKGCCSQSPEFITGRLPVLESVFRLLLANGNQPLGLAELEKRLAERRGDAPHRTPTESLVRLLENDSYYGLRLAE